MALSNRLKGHEFSFYRCRLKLSALVVELSALEQFLGLVSSVLLDHGGPSLAFLDDLLGGASLGEVLIFHSRIGDVVSVSELTVETVQVWFTEAYWCRASRL